MSKRIQKTLSIGLSAVLALGIGALGAGTLGIGVANASNTVASNAVNVLHEMVPHVVLPETVQYNKTAKNLPSKGYSGVQSPHVASYVAYPSYQVPQQTEFRSVGQAVYPVTSSLPPQLPSPALPSPMLKAPLPEQLDGEALEEKFTWQSDGENDVILSGASLSGEPIQLASTGGQVVPTLPSPNRITQTGIFCQHPAKPPTAWAFSSPIFKAASVPTGWGGNNVGTIMHHGLRGCTQQVGFQPAGMVAPSAEDAASGMAVPGMAGVQGIPYSTFQMGRNRGQQGLGNFGVGQPFGSGHMTQPQTAVLPNGMVLLTMPPNHSGCGLLRCRGNAPRTILLPPAGAFPQMQQGMQQGLVPPPATSFNNMMMDNMMMNSAMAGGMNVPFMQVSQPQMMPAMIPQMPQMMPVMAMTPMGPAIVGFQQAPAMNPMLNPMMNQMPMLQPTVQQMTAQSEPMVGGEVAGENMEAGEGAADAETPNQMQLVATPYGYAIQVPTDALQGDTAHQLFQMQQAMMQQNMMQSQQMQMMNPYGMNPYGVVNPMMMGYSMMNPMMNPMMNAGYNPMMGQPMAMTAPQQGLSVSDVVQIMAMMNNNKPQRRGLMERIAERRETRQANGVGDDPFAQLMAAWSTPYVAPDTALRMPSRNAYPYGNFGVQALPVNTANYGGYHNLYFGNTGFPGVY